MTGFPARQRPGHRGRLGIIQPAPGMMLEHEWPAVLPADVLFPVARLRLRGTTPAHYADIAAAAPAAAEDLVSAGADVIGYACSVGSLIDGAAAEARLIAALAHTSGKPAVSIADASMQGLRRLGALRIAVMTPYLAETRALVAGYARERGFEVVAEPPMPVGIAESGNLSAAEIAALAIAAMRALPSADALWIPCTAVRTLEAIPAIESATGRAVVSGSQALLWAMLRAIGIDDALACGVLGGRGASMSSVAFGHHGPDQGQWQQSPAAMRPGGSDRLAT